MCIIPTRKNTLS